MGAAADYCHALSVSPRGWCHRLGIPAITQTHRTTVWCAADHPSVTESKRDPRMWGGGEKKKTIEKGKEKGKGGGRRRETEECFQLQRNLFSF